MKTRMPYPLLRSASIMSCVLFSILLLANSANGHGHHDSVAQMQYNSETGKLEISLRVWPADIERAIAAATGKRFDIEETEGAEEILARYVQHTFRVTQGDKKKQLTIAWVGQELDKHIWLHFEIPVKNLNNLEFSNRVCFEVEPKEQVNTILFLHQSKRLALQSTGKSPTAKLDLDQLK